MDLKNEKHQWVDKLRSALDNKCSLSKIQSICQGRMIPSSIRPDLWQFCLNVTNKPNKMAFFDGIFDLPFQKRLRESCIQFVENLGNDEDDKVSVLSDLESILTFYCKNRNLKYETQNGWIELLMPLLSLRLDRSHTFNLFEGILDNYIPIDLQKQLLVFDVFRLLILYHDPELCSMLDTKKINPVDYIRLWFQSIFATTCTLSTVLCIWDKYFLQNDPFQILFLSLTMLLNSREDLLAMKKECNEKIIAFIENIPTQLEQEDIYDLWSLAQYYKIKSPSSFKLDLLEGIFNNMCRAFDENRVTQALCLPVSVYELIGSVTNDTPNLEVRFFLVDCRPAEQYNKGHLRTAFHLDCKLMLQEPNAFLTAVQGLRRAQKNAIEANSNAGGEHLCFMGTGRLDNDQYTHMVVAYFLQKNIRHVSLLSGGYLSIHNYVGDKMSDCLEDHDSHRCAICNENQELFNNLQNIKTIESTESNTKIDSSDILTKLSTVIKMKSSAIKGKFVEYVVNTANENLSGNSNNENFAVKSMNSFLPSVFSIDDEDVSLINSRDVKPKQKETIHLGTYLKNPDIVASFKCQEVHLNGNIYESHLIVTSESMIVLREVDSKGNCQLTAKRPLSNVVKITAKRKHKDLITFKYGASEGENIVVTDMDRFLIPNSTEATAIVSKYILKCFKE